MKNLFKNLMLVAVAAMAFTACSEDNNEVNEVAKKTVISGVLSFDEDTRSGFVGTETTDNGDGTTTTVYKSAWKGGETIKLFAENGLETTATVDEEGKFTAKFEGELPESFFMTIVSPAGSWSSKDIPTIPAEQTPLANSVDPLAHILKAQNVQVTNGSADAANMGHEVAYGKMTVNGVDFDIDHVVVNLKGTYYQNYERECTYTINADNVQNNVFWFTTETFENVTEFTVTAYDAEGKAVTKTVDVAAADKTLSFNYGRVSTFSVSGLEAVEEPDTVMDSAKYYFDYNNYGGYDNWGYVVFEDEFLGTLVLNCTFPNNDLVLKIGTYSAGNYTQGFDVGYSYYNVVGGNPSSLNYNYTSTMTVDVVDGKYSISLDVKNNNDETLEATYVGDIEGLGYPDLRTPLATPNVTYSVDGKTITLSWTAVEGADGYRVKLLSPYDEYLEEIVTTNEYVYEAQLYSKEYSFTIMSYANDENVTYKSSDDAYAYVTTGKDPSIWADVVANNIVWDSSKGAFKMTGEVVSGTAWGHSGDYIRIYINESDRPGNNSIKVGTYTGCGGTSPQAGQFGAKLYLYWGNTTYESAFGSNSTVEVSYDETVGYTIILTHDGKTYGYKGMPEGWVAPSAGGDDNTGEGGDDNTGEGGDDNTGEGGALGTIDNPYTFASVASNGFFLNFEGAENGASLQLDRQNSDVNQMSNYGGPFALNYTAIIYAGSGNIYNVNGTVYNYAQFAPSSTLEVTKADGNWTCKLKMSVDGGATFTYYTYTGQIANQAY